MELVKSPLHYVIKHQEKYGNLFEVDSVSHKVMFTTHPDVAKHLLVDNNKAYCLVVAVLWPEWSDMCAVVVVDNLVATAADGSPCSAHLQNNTICTQCTQYIAQ